MENCNGIITSLHAFRRMWERGISDKAIEQVLEKGEVLKDYPDDKPYPSKLILGFVNDMPVHLVLAKDENGVCIIITVYIPDSDIWNTDFRTKKQDV